MRIEPRIGSAASHSDPMALSLPGKFGGEFLPMTNFAFQIFVCFTFCSNSPSPCSKWHKIALTDALFFLDVPSFTVFLLSQFGSPRGISDIYLKLGILVTSVPHENLCESLSKICPYFASPLPAFSGVSCKKKKERKTMNARKSPSFIDTCTFYLLSVEAEEGNSFSSMSCRKSAHANFFALFLPLPLFPRLCTKRFVIAAKTSLTPQPDRNEMLLKRIIEAEFVYSKNL